MGDINQLDFVRTHRDRFRAPVLEVGSHDYGSTRNLRSLFADAETQRATGIGRGHPLRSLSVSLLRLLTGLGPLRWLAGNRYVMVPSMIDMIGTKPR